MPQTTETFFVLVQVFQNGHEEIIGEYDTKAEAEEKAQNFRRHAGKWFVSFELRIDSVERKVFKGELIQ